MAKKQAKNSEKSEKFYIINNVFKFTPAPEWNFGGLNDEPHYAPDPNFDWPEYRTEHERIFKNSQKYKDFSIVEAFESEFNTPINIESDIPEILPMELKIGQVINVDILGVQKRSINFSTTSLKSNLYSITDLYKYSKFRDIKHPIYDVPVKVTDVKRDEVRVDVMSPMIESFVLPRVQRNWIQKVIGNPQTVRVRDLQLTRGGFLGKAIIPSISEFLGEEYTIDAFIPGSQIVLNITSDFEQFVGKSVDAFVVNYIQKPGSDKMSLVCSVKEYLKFKGEEEMIKMFNHWCEDDETWSKTKDQKMVGKVTGIINSSKKCGVFVEIPDLNITGMIGVSPTDLVKYHPKDIVMVNICGFEEEMYFNQKVQQMQHVDPYKITDNCIEKCTLKPILKIAE